MNFQNKNIIIIDSNTINYLLFNYCLVQTEQLKAFLPDFVFRDLFLVEMQNFGV